MIKIYLDWNIITHLKENKNLYDYIIKNKGKLIFPYSKAHLKDLLASKNHNNEYFEKDLYLLNEICEHHLLEYEQDINNPLPYKCFPKDYLEIKNIELELFNSDFSNESFCKVLKKNNLDVNTVISILEKEKINPYTIPYINKSITNVADIFSILSQYSRWLFNNKNLQKQIQEYLHRTTNEYLYKEIQGANSRNVFHKLNAITLPQTNKTFVDIVENSIIEKNKSNLELFISQYLALNFCGFLSDKRRRLQNIYTDAEHAYYASSCDLFVSNDSRLREKASAIYNLYNINTKIINSNELETTLDKEFSYAYDIDYIFHNNITYNTSDIIENDKGFKQLPYHFLGLFNYYYNLKVPNSNNITYVFKVIISQRSYIFYTELEQFFKLILSLISDERQKQLFRELFISKFLTRNKEIIDTAIFEIDSPNYLIQLSADKDSHIPLPILFITKKVD